MLLVEPLDGSPLPKKRRRRREGRDPIDSLPAEWKALAARWVRRGAKAASGSRWETLAAEAGPEGYPLATRLLDWLLHAGWIAVIEERRHGGWRPMRVEFVDLAGLREGLGLPDPEEDVRRWRELRASFDPAGRPELTLALEQLATLPPRRAAQRAELLWSLARWADEGRSGTRRDFAQFARGETKAITEAEWRWLEEAVDLAAYAIEPHTPLLFIAASVALELPAGILNLDAAPDFAALTPASVTQTRSGRGSVGRWRLVENRTSFERLARAREPDTAVVWLPGYPPGWWQEAMARLLGIFPAHAGIACDPDPAGIAIALEAGRLWEKAGLPWHPWRMDTESLSTLPVRRALDAADHAILARLAEAALPPTLRMLVQWMREHGEKGEQEGLL